MTTQELADVYANALREEDFDAISKIISILNSDSPGIKKEREPLYRRIDEDLFNLNRSVNNLDIQKFLREITDWEKSQSTERPKPVAAPPKPEIEPFERSFIAFYNRHRKIFSELKDFHLYRLENADAECLTKVSILCCDTSLNLPALNELQRNESVLTISKQTIAEFLDHHKTPAVLKGGYIGVLVVAPNLRSIEGLQSELEHLFDLFESVSMITINIRDSEISVADYDEEKNMPKAISSITEYTGKVFNNKMLSYDVQRVIKLFFEKRTAVIDYRVLNAGLSGAAVIEVQAIPLHMAMSKRYVIKIAKKELGKRGKLELEMENFDKYVKDAATKGTSYLAAYKQTEVFEAIQYNYASSGGLQDAYSFSTVLTNYLARDKKEPDRIDLFIRGLLSCELFVNGWATPRRIQKKCSAIYASYLRNDKKIFEAMEEINDTAVDLANIKARFEQVKEFILETNEKVCHGDLHTDNCFWDGEMVTLIDFGLTGEHHAIVDHSFLEASIRLKHFPRYIPLEELLEYELGLMDMGSFDVGFDLSFIRREKLKELYRLIIYIRADSRKYFFNRHATKEYFLSLFLITVRQTQYADLHQLYGLKLSDLFAKKLELV